MAKYSRAFLDELNKRTDMLELAREYTDMKRTSKNNYQGICPHPDHPDDRPSFTVWKNSNSWSCFGCHAGHKNKNNDEHNYGSDPVAFIQWIENKGFQESVRYLAERIGMKIEEDQYEEEYLVNYRKAKAYHANLSIRAEQYLVDRGIDDQLIEKWLIGFDGSRITFPLKNHFGQIVGFTRRILVEQENEPKYINSYASEIFNKSEYFYGEHLIDRTLKKIRITEGPTDVVLSNKNGLQNIVATLGTSFTEKHAQIIKKIGLTPVFIMDGDKPGLKSIHRAANMMNEIGVRSNVVILPQDMDLAELSLVQGEALEAWINHHEIPYSQLLIEEKTRIYESAMNQIRMELYPDVAQIIQSINDPSEKQVMKDYVYDKMKMIFR